MANNETIVGIDLGTTNSEVAAYVDGNVRVLNVGGALMLPSCVGLSADGELLVGTPARNQSLLYPERTVRSIKRKMGSTETVSLDGKTFSPQEISAIILRELVQAARQQLGAPIERAVITVPAYFSDAQRQATREAGALAGLDVVRILNEPTAASLAYGHSGEDRQTVLVYDLGGGTFDVSVVTIEGDVTEVLASHGNNHLGGDDFDDLLFNRLSATFQEQHGITLRNEYPAARARLRQAAEEAKKRLSSEPFTSIREEALVTIDGTPLHLEAEVSRAEYEDLIRSLLDSTLDSVAKAMDDAGKRPRDLDGVLLVGGATRTPLIRSILEERAGFAVRQDVDPDLCVALGAGVLASRIAGHEIERVLVDVSPYSFGISYLGERGGFPYPHCYKPIIHRNTPLPVTRTELYFTSHPFQSGVSVKIFQGDDPDALKDIPLGDFLIEGLTEMEDSNEILCRMALDIDGILHVTAVEKCTGLSKHIRVDNAMQAKSDEEVNAARLRIEGLFATRPGSGDEFDEDTGDEAEDYADTREDGAKEMPREGDPQIDPAVLEAEQLVTRCRGLLNAMHDEDKEEAVEYNEAIEDAIASRDRKALKEATASLRELLFFVEGK